MLQAFFDINNIFFTVLGYPMSYLEFFGTILNILTVWLVAKKKIWNWPVGIVAVILFASLFYQIRLYSDFLEQIYFLFTGIWGWIVWSKLNKQKAATDTQTTIIKGSWYFNGLVVLAIIIGTILLGVFMSRIHIFFPALFPEATTFPFLDAFTTVASFAAQFLLIYQRIENWYLWIMIDVIGIWLYNEKDVKFVSLLYFIFLIIATNGLIRWQRELRRANEIKRVNLGKGAEVV
jgi:nicotinamide mononucleotide transporter